MIPLDQKRNGVWHELDIEYFRDHPAPIMERVHSGHFTNINSTITFLGPMLYFLVRELGCEQVLEIGHAEGYTAYYLANAVKDNATRFKMEGNRYYGIDIVQTERLQQFMKDYDLPATILNLDSMKLTPETFKDVKFDLIFQDGNHDTEHVIHELKTMYPQLKGEGKGYWIFHDCYGPAEEGFHKLLHAMSDCPWEFEFEYTRIFSTYGMAIMRKMEGYDYGKRYWF
jgi:hypothetical protein